MLEMLSKSGSICGKRAAESSFQIGTLIKGHLPEPLIHIFSTWMLPDLSSIFNIFHFTPGFEFFIDTSLTGREFPQPQEVFSLDILTKTLNGPISLSPPTKIAAFHQEKDTTCWSNSVDQADFESMDW